MPLFRSEWARTTQFVTPNKAHLYHLWEYDLRYLLNKKKRESIYIYTKLAKLGQLLAGHSALNFTKIKIKKHELFNNGYFMKLVVCS
jgi:hypothetical protein